MRNQEYEVFCICEPKISNEFQRLIFFLSHAKISYRGLSFTLQRDK